MRTAIITTISLYAAGTAITGAIAVRNYHRHTGEIRYWIRRQYTITANTPSIYRTRLAHHQQAKFRAADSLRQCYAWPLFAARGISHIITDTKR